MGYGIGKHVLPHLLLSTREENAAELVFGGQTVESVPGDSRVVLPVYHGDDPHDGWMF
jgi:hypothetical protein